MRPWHPPTPATLVVLLTAKKQAGKSALRPYLGCPNGPKPLIRKRFLWSDPNANVVLVVVLVVVVVVVLVVVLGTDREMPRNTNSTTGNSMDHGLAVASRQ